MIRALLLLPAAMLPTVAEAQESAPSSGDEIVVTAQRNNQTQVRRAGSVGVLGDKAAEDVPFSVRSYSEALIYNQQPQSLGQVLENDPTIRTSYGFANASEQFVIRGFTLFGDDVALDGLYGITPRQLVAPELYDSVQVLGGATAFLNGAAPGGSGIGGSINLMPKRAGSRPLTRATLTYLSKSHVGGSFDVGRRSSDGRFGVRVNGALRRGDVAVDGEDRRALLLGAGFDYPGADVRVTLDLGYQKIRVERLRPKVTVTSFVPRVPRADANYAQPWTYTELTDLFGTAKVEWDVARNVMLYAQAGARDGSEDGIYGGITVIDPSGAATGSATVVPRTDNNEAAQAGLRAKLANAGTTHELNAGVSHVRQVNRNAYDFLTGYVTNLYATPEVPLPQSAFAGGNLADPYPIARARLTGLFASDTIGFAEDRVLLTAGLRHQEIKVRGYDYVSGALASQYSKNAVTPVVGLVIKPRSGLSLYANRIEGLQQGPVAPVDPTISNPGEVFAPIRSRQVELGGKVQLGRLNASLAAFRIKRPSAFAVADPTATGMFRYGLFGEQRNQGLELTLDGELARGLRLIAGASYIDAKLTGTPGGTNDGKQAPGVPRVLANANLEYDVSAVRGLTLTGRVIATGRQPVDAANTLHIGGWTRADLGARFVTLIGERPLTLRGGVDNVFNKRYWSSAFETFGTSLLQGQPRTVRLSASVDM